MLLSYIYIDVYVFNYINWLMKSEEKFGVFILNVVKEFYNGVLLPNNKIQTNEWSVVSGIVLENNDEFKLIAFSNGTRALPNKHYFNKQFQIFDCHSEILTVKSFQFFILKCLVFNLITHFNIKPCLSVLAQTEYEQFNKHKEFFSIFDFSDNKIHLKHTVHFHMYISSPPCGECSINDDVSYINNGAKLIEECLCHFTNNNERIKNDIAFRTKSIRSDYTKDILSLSLSCSDKLMIKNMIGFQGIVLSELIDNVCMSSIIITNNKKVNEMQIVKGMNACKRNVNICLTYKEPNIIIIDESVFTTNNDHVIECNDKNSQPFSIFYYYSLTIQKIDGSTGLKCGSRTNNINILDKLRPTISKYDLHLHFYNTLIFIQEHKLHLHFTFTYIHSLISRLQSIILHNKTNTSVNDNKLHLHDIIHSLIKTNSNYQMKTLLYQTYPILLRFHSIKHELILKNNK